MNITRLASILALILATTLTWHAQVPQLINYQGRVAVGGVNFDSAAARQDGRFKFALVDGEGTSLWSNDGTSSKGSEPTDPVRLTVTKGLYAVLLGDKSLTNLAEIPSSAFATKTLYLRVWFDDGAHGSQLLTPDQRSAAVGYAIMAQTAESAQTVPNGAPSPPPSSPTAR